MKRGDANPGRSGSHEDESSAALRALRGHMDLDEVEAAVGVYRQARERLGPWSPPPRDWMDLIKAILAAGDRENAVQVMEDYVNGVEAPSPRIQLKLAQLLIQSESRPAQALRILDAIPTGSLPEPLEALRGRLRTIAQAMRDDGPPELEPLR
ncbi:hypothetical protein OJF2_21140 [Aquisphaera giovannonii]|uniref:Tetratricopeptide repeat protein n=1 Tax=Aquisphaera giovannonii TaxID=406548 RepID=A0A5B9W101_9BACT|nr:hypothetical protein [Aquisphaera giovannonii]QEH33610.1 hypothetical protein OJF2_21140 [Aquisphaera giovannonii]